MIAKAKGRFLPLGPRKMRAVIRLIKGMDVPRAQAILQQLPRGAAKPIAKVLNSAVANATRAGTFHVEQLKISRIMADEGPIMKRFRPSAMGRSMEIRKKFSHVTIELEAMS